MFKDQKRMWIAVFLLGWAFDFLFWGHAPGVSFAIYVALTLVTGYFLLKAEGHRPAQWTLLLLMPIALYAIMTFTRTEGLTLFVSYSMALLLMAIFVVNYVGGHWLEYSLADYVVRAFQLVGSAIGAPVALFFTGKKAGAEQPAEEAKSTEGKPEAKTSQFWPIVRGILVAIPVIAIFASLLASADVVFAQKLNDVIEMFRLEKLPEYILRAVYISMLAYVLMGIFIHAAHKSLDEKLYGLEKPLVPPFFGFTEATIVLGAVELLFASFVVIQFQYFFGGNTNIHIDGYTYSEYARRGFGELVTVAFFSLIMFLGLSTITRREGRSRQRTFSFLGVGLVVLVFIMLLSAYYRLNLYEQAYGFTRDRTYTHVFMIWLGILLIVTVILDLLQRQRAFALAAMLTMIGFTLSLGLLNVDAFIATQNVARTKSGADLDVAYLASLSADAVPALAESYADKSLDQSTRDMVGASLACIKDQESFGEFEYWQSFNLSEWKAGKILAGMDLSKYTFSDRDVYPLTVTTPMKMEFECYGYYYD